ncbi:WbqC family protein [Caenimonas sedimenti]|uniref:WbqC family protein n=1 Tax=Caenimonas sedimenti TaxID=2596921 RepID=A0A562ZF95_9BURK|nr:WbqC family protein [Caenimonas sedimenti]TWO66648.1 WbqC family protein [Caenimonas sedimenti]
MKLALMQPYFFPYLGYFSLLAAVDRFVFYDEVQWIKNGWVNRNRVLVGGATSYLTVPVRDAGPSRTIAEVEVAKDAGWRRKMFEMVRHAYRKAPYFAPVHDLLQQAVPEAQPHVSAMAKASVRLVAGYLALPVELVDDPGRQGEPGLIGPERVLGVCRDEKATAYWNLPGGKALYDAERFQAAGVALRFVEPVLEPYPQFAAAFVPGLSMLDVLMHNSPQEARRMAEAGVPA